MLNDIQRAFQNGIDVLAQFIGNQDHIQKVSQVATQLAQQIQAGAQILICGNGGSLCDAMHFAEEFSGKYRKERKPLPVLALADPAHITCVGNDYGFDQIFSRGVDAYGRKGDVLIVLSTSGQSENIVKAVQMAQSKGLLTVALLGKTGGKLKGVCDYEWIVPGLTSDRIQEIHMMILHILIEGIERVLFPELYL